MTSSKKHERVLKWTNRIGGVPQAAPDWLHPNGSRTGPQRVTVGGEEESDRDGERAGVNSRRLAGKRGKVSVLLHGPRVSSKHRLRVT